MTDLDSLVARCREGDPLAWEALVRRFQGRVFSLAFHYLHDPEEARDLAQEIFVKIWKGLASFSGEAFLPWMLRIARNACVDRLRRKKARPPLSDVEIDDQTQLSDGGPGPEESWIADDRRRMVYRAMKGMTAQNREILLLKEIQGLELREISKMLGVPVGTVKSRSNRARVDLARRILALDPSYGEAT